MKLTKLGAALFAIATIAAPVAAQSEADFERADQYARSGDASAMQAAYDAILLSDPGNLRALVGRATARSWQGDRQGARTDYRAALSQDARNLEALVGLGYDYAWGGDWSDADATFQSALSIAPDLLSAQKGRAFTALWSGDANLALTRFDAIARAHPGDAEALRGAAQARLAMGQAGRAEAAFRETLSVAPGDAASLEGIRAARSLPALVEAGVWVGNSAEGGDIGLRAAEIGSWLTPDTRIGVRYDNSLSLDNPTLARQGIDAEAWFLNAQKTFDGRFIAIGEIGTRELPDGVDQEIYKLEGILLDSGRSYKLGAQLSPTGAGYDDQLVYGGIGFPVAERIRFDTTVFLARSGAAEDEELRGAVFGEYTSPERWTLGGGVGLGDVSSDTPGVSGTVTTANLLATTPVMDRHTLYLQARWEDAPLTEYSSVMVGFTVRFPRP